MSDNERQHTQFTGMADYIAALDTVCGLAQRTLYLFEKNYEDLGFNSEARFNLLRHFLLSHSHAELRVLAHDPQYLARNCPRMTILLKQFSHNMSIHRTPQHLQHLTEPFAVADDRHYVRRFHFDDSRGLLAQHDPEGARALKSQFHEMWEASQPAVSASTLGL